MRLRKIGVDNMDSLGLKEVVGIGMGSRIIDNEDGFDDGDGIMNNNTKGFYGGHSRHPPINTNQRGSSSPSPQPQSQILKLKEIKDYTIADDERMHKTHHRQSTPTTTTTATYNDKLGDEEDQDDGDEDIIIGNRFLSPSNTKPTSSTTTTSSKLLPTTITTDVPSPTQREEGNNDGMRLGKIGVDNMGVLGLKEVVGIGLGSRIIENKEEYDDGDGIMNDNTKGFYGGHSLHPLNNTIQRGTSSPSPQQQTQILKLKEIMNYEIVDDEEMNKTHHRQSTPTATTATYNDKLGDEEDEDDGNEDNIIGNGFLFFSTTKPTSSTITISSESFPTTTTTDVPSPTQRQERNIDDMRLGKIGVDNMGVLGLKEVVGIGVGPRIIEKKDGSDYEDSIIDNNTKGSQGGHSRHPPIDTNQRGPSSPSPQQQSQTLIKLKKSKIVNYKIVDDEDMHKTHHQQSTLTPTTTIYDAKMDEEENPDYGEENNNNWSGYIEDYVDEEDDDGNIESEFDRYLLDELVPDGSQHYDSLSVAPASDDSNGSSSDSVVGSTFSTSGSPKPVEDVDWGSDSDEDLAVPPTLENLLGCWYWR